MCGRPPLSSGFCQQATDSCEDEKRLEVTGKTPSGGILSQKNSLFLDVVKNLFPKLLLVAAAVSAGFANGLFVEATI